MRRGWRDKISDIGKVAGKVGDELSETILLLPTLAGMDPKVAADAWMRGYHETGSPEEGNKSILNHAMGGRINWLEYNIGRLQHYLANITTGGGVR